MKIFTAFLILLIGALLGVLLAKGLFSISTLTGVSAIVLVVLFAVFFVARDGLRRARKRWGT